ncbi:MAG: PQQ-dependent sugar dehydrogenase [Gemmatimonadaceae bacterium]
MPTARLALASLPLAFAAGVAGAQQPPVTKDRPDCQPVETRAPNATAQRPAFAGQTRACAVRSSAAPAVTVITRELDAPWAVEPLPDGSFLVTEKPGRMRIVTAAGTVSPPIEGVPPVDARGQGGLLDVALSPSFATDRTVFWSFSEPRGGNTNATSVARGVLSADGRRLEQVRVIFRAQPPYAGTMHFGSRLAFAPDGMLHVTLGERSDMPMRPLAQRLDNHMGKTLRITRDGAAAPGNPFAGQAGAVPEIWSLGHRNVQAAAFDPQGRFWVIEHGTRGGDELNLVERGKNYGWPIQAYGIEYAGGPIQGGSTTTTREGTEQPVYYWDPVIAPSGAQWYTGSLFPEWRGNLFVGGLQAQALVRLVVENGRVTGEEHLFHDRGKRIRDVRQGPDGALYIVTDRSPGELWRVAPR